MQPNPITEQVLEAMIFELASKPGNIITFTDKANLSGFPGKQIAVKEILRDPTSGAFRILGLGRVSPWYRNTKDLAKDVDLEFTGISHGICFPNTSLPCLFLEHSTSSNKNFTCTVNSVRKDGKIYFEDFHSGTEFQIHIADFIQECKQGKFTFLQPEAIHSLIKDQQVLPIKAQKQDGDANPLYDREFNSDFMEALEEGIASKKTTHSICSNEEAQEIKKKGRRLS